MEIIEDAISLKLSEAFKKCFDVDVAPDAVKFQKTHSGFKGDITFVVFPFLSLTKNSPDNTAKKLGEYLINNTSEVKDIEVVKGFLNICISDRYYINWLKDNFYRNNFSLPKKNNLPILLEFSSPNTNKPLHLGHIRNNLLGWSLSQILECAGNTVKRLNLINDRGIHICKSMLGYMKWGNGETPESCGVKGDKLVGKYYVLFENKYKQEINELVAKGLTADEAAKTAPLITEAQDILRKWEGGNKEIIALWQKMNSWVFAGFESTYKRLGINFDKTYYESDIYKYGKQIILSGLSDGKLSKEEDGSVWADFTEEGLDKKILLRADGTSVYITQDIGTAVLRYDEFKPSKMIYVVGNEQIYHFDVLKKALQKLGFEWYNKIFHLSYGMVELPEGKMKTREGKVVDADDLIDEMYITAKKITSELGKNNDMDEKKSDELYNTIGLGALKYFILKVSPKKNMLFNPDESIDFNGNTGPFIQYTYARINSLLNKAETIGLKPEINDINFNISTTEKNLIKTLRDFKNIIAQAAEELDPSVIANYVYELTKLFNQFYQEVPVLKEENNALKLFRLAFAFLTLNVVKASMSLLGINVPEKM